MKIFLFLFLVMIAPMTEGGCSTNTGGTCSWWSCDSSRGAQCVNSKCICPSGKCAVGGKCINKCTQNSVKTVNSITYDKTSTILSETPHARTSETVLHPETATVSWAKEESKMTFTSHDVGVSVTTGATVQAGIPMLAKGEVSVEVTGSYNHQWGQETTTSYSTGLSHTCEAEGPGWMRECSYEFREVTYKVGYTMGYTDNRGDSCTSRGSVTLEGNLDLKYTRKRKFHCPHISNENGNCATWKQQGKCTSTGMGND